MLQALQLQGTFHEAQGLTILTGAFLGFYQSPSCQYHEMIFKACCSNIIRSLR
jgi:hypothetical protein